MKTPWKRNLNLNFNLKINFQKIKGIGKKDLFPWLLVTG